MATSGKRFCPMASSTALAGFHSLTGDSFRHVMDCLEVRDRIALLSTKRALYEAEPLATHFVSYCRTCEHCVAKATHLCEQALALQAEDFWKCLLRRSHSQLMELRVASSEGFTARALADPTCSDALKGLRVLEMNRCLALGKEGLMALAQNCHNLHTLAIHSMSLDSEGLALLLANNAKTLRVVDLAGCHTLTGDDIHALTVCQGLRDLSLAGCHSIDNKAIIHVVERVAKIERLNLRYCHKVDDRVVASLAEHLPGLRDLNLRYCYKVSDQGLQALSDFLPRLNNLNLSQCSRITDCGIQRIVSSMQQLKELRLWGCTKLTSVSVFAISAGLPSLTLVDIRSRDKFEAVIGGQTALKFLIQTYRNTLTKWEQDGKVGVFKRPLACVAVGVI